MPNPEANIADIRLACRRLSTPGFFNTIDDVRRELVDNVYPAMEALAHQVKETIDEVDEIADAQGSFIDEELGQTILGALASAAAVVEEVKKLPLDDMTKQRIMALCDAHSHAAEVASLAITEAMGFEDDEEADEADGDGVGDESEAE